MKKKILQKKVKFYLVILLFFIINIWIIFANNQSITLNPLYFWNIEEKKLAYNCSNTINIDWNIKNLKELHIEINYNYDKININKILLTNKGNNIKQRYKILDNKVIYTLKSNKNYTINWTIFSINFEVTTETTNTKFILQNSYYVDKKWNKHYLDSNKLNLNFFKINNCNPDIQPPLIKLITPQSWSKNNDINQKVIIKIQDKKSWVNWDSIEIKLDWLTYKKNDKNLKIENNLITIKPVLEYSYWTAINLEIKVKDNVWNENFKKYIFYTTSNSPMCKELGCNTSLWRQITTKECIQFQKMYLIWDDKFKKTIKKLFKDLELKCSFDNIKKLEKNIQNFNLKEKKIQTVKKISLNIFAILWRVLFFITFLLKLIYIKKYKKLKKTFKS